MPEARSTTVLDNERGATRGREKMKQELNRKISKSRAKESGRNKGLDIRPCPEPAQRQTGLTREMRKLNLKHSVAASSVTVDLHRRQQLEMVKKRLEEYGEPYLVGEYKKFMMTFDSGCPAQFWIFANTEALYDLQAFIQRMDRGKKGPGDGGGPDVGVGSLVLARYSVDNALYRAKVEDIIDEEVFSVRYIDYGNSEDCLSKSEIYKWDKMLELVPPQAVSCCFYGAEESFTKKTSLTIKEIEAFTSLMKKSSPMQMVVHKRSSLPQDVFNASATLLVPDLTVG